MYESQNVEKIIKLLEPIINKRLLQTHPKNREDLKQEIILSIITRLNKVDLNVPGFFEIIEQIKSSSEG